MSSSSSTPPKAPAAPASEAAAQSTSQMVTVHLPSQLRARTQQRAVVETPSGAVHEVIMALDALFPGIRFNLCFETGELRPFVNIFVNGYNVRYLSMLDTPVPGGSAIHIIHSVAGG
ncbi:MAG: MoaD/ThiS family protein [Ktedonobacterales bacterium]